MRIRKIELLSDYKCFKKGTIFNFHDTPIICIIGKNSTGKTIFLEILYNIFNRIQNFDWKYNQIQNFNLKTNCYFQQVENFNWEIEVKDKNNCIYIISWENKHLYLNNNILYLDTKRLSLSNIGLSSYNNISKKNSIFYEVLRILNLKIDCINSICYIRDNLSLFYHNLSSGEQNMISVFSLFPEKNDSYTQKEYLYLLDEPDKYLNNELKRKYISLLKEAMSENDQIIFTTHSTELISDLQEIQVYKCENFEIKNINFNPFGEDSSALTEKLFDDKFTISDIAKNTYDNYREKIKSASIDELYQLKSEIKAIFSDNIYRKELLKLINDSLSLLNI